MAQLNVEQHHVVVLAGDGGFCLITVKPAINLNIRPRGANPCGELGTGGLIIFDQGDFGRSSHFAIMKLVGWASAEEIFRTRKILAPPLKT